MRELDERPGIDDQYLTHSHRGKNTPFPLVGLLRHGEVWNALGIGWGVNCQKAGIQNEKFRVNGDSCRRAQATRDFRGTLTESGSTIRMLRKRLASLMPSDGS
jgi:hypothetical protein